MNNKNKNVSWTGTLPTKERIFVAAVDLFSKNGYNGVSIRDIAKTVGIKESSLYNHYPGKEKILEAILDRFQEEHAIRTAPPQELEELVKSLSVEEFWSRSVTRYLDYWGEPLRLKIWSVVSMEQYSNPRAGKLILDETRNILEFIETVFRKMIAARKVRPLDPKLLASAYGYAMRAMHLEYAIQKAFRLDTPASRERMFEFIRFLAGLIGPESAGSTNPGLAA